MQKVKILYVAESTNSQKLLKNRADWVQNNIMRLKQ
jgi:hypothetical protein